MKTLFLLSALMVFTGLTVSAEPGFDRSLAVNPILGDASYQQAFHTQPAWQANNELRIQTHLAYVEKLLRNADVSHLSTTLQKRRTHILDLLHVYWNKAVFPKNYDYANERRPCFIDKDGTICAVGYLIEQTTCRAVAEYINSKFKYAYLMDMNDPLIDLWIANSGLTKVECAMIQPTYGPQPTYSINYVPPAYGISSAVWSGLNVSLMTMNGIQIGRGYKNPAFPIMGLVSGAGQIILGAAMWPADINYGWGEIYSNDSQKGVCMMNIGLGTSTMILSTINLIINRKMKNKLTTWNVYTYPTYNNQVGIGFNFSRSF